MPSNPDPRQLREKRDELRSELARVGDLRSGSLVERYRRCGKSNCHCAASTGVVEAGCKTAIGTRCKRAGMHWTVAGADAIIALRCCKLSGRFEDFWERRPAASTRTAA